jgi:hypothetical protein
LEVVAELAGHVDFWSNDFLNIVCPKRNNNATYDLGHILTGRFKHIAKGFHGKGKERRLDDGRGGQIDGEKTAGSNTATR